MGESRTVMPLLNGTPEEHPARRSCMWAGAARQYGLEPCFVVPPLGHPNLSCAASPATLVVPVLHVPATRSRVGHGGAKRAANGVVSSLESVRNSF